MRIRTLELGGAGVAQSFQDQIQNEEPPGSEIQMNTGRGWVRIGREQSFNPSLLADPGPISMYRTIRTRPMRKTRLMHSCPARTEEPLRPR